MHFDVKIKSLAMTDLEILEVSLLIHLRFFHVFAQPLPHHCRKASPNFG
jgi:hypothetical protein